MQHCGLRGACLPGALLHCGRDPGTQKCFGAGDVSAVDVKGGGGGTVPLPHQGPNRMNGKRGRG